MVRWVRGTVWVALLTVACIAAAGLVLALDHPPTDASRPELTARAASILAPRLAAIDAPLGRLGVAAGSLASAGRDTLVRLRALDASGASASISAGKTALVELTRAAEEARALAPGLLQGIDGSRLPVVDQARLAAIDGALAGVDGIVAAWADIERVASAPTGLLNALDRHDDALARAVAGGRAERFPDALDALAGASEALAEATAIGDGASAAGREVAALDGWLLPLADYDGALGALYSRLDKAGSVLTPAVESALAAVHAAHAALPPTRDALVIAVMDLGGGDITLGLLAIDDAHGAIEAALGPDRAPG